MKPRKLLIFILFCLVSNPFFAQNVPDPLWLLKGSDFSGNFVIEAVAHPDTSFDIRAKNDILVIYEDGSYYSSRSPIVAASHPFFVEDNDTSYYITNNDETKISYLYFTNLYEGDDDRPTARSLPANSENYETVVISPLTTPPTASCNHDVVTDKDITLTIKIKKRDKSCSDTVLVNYNILRDEYDNESAENIFKTSNVFNSSYIFPKPNWKNHDSNSSTIKFVPNNDQQGIYHLNFKTEDLDDSLIGKEAIFKISNIGSNCPEEEVVEVIRAAHDPNCIRVLQVCKGKIPAIARLQCVKYQLSFENDKTDVVTDIAVVVEMNEIMRSQSIVVDEWKVGNSDINNSGTIDIEYEENNTIRFTFDNVALASINNENNESRIGYINFTVKTSRQNELYNDQLECNASVLFNGSKMQLNNCEPVVKGGLNRLREPCTCEGDRIKKRVYGIAIVIVALLWATVRWIRKK